MKDENIFTFRNVYDCWKNETPYKTYISVNFNDNATGSQNSLSGGTYVTFKRNTLTTITINITPTSGFSINEEDWSEDNLIDLKINTDGVIDTPVEPTE